MADNTSNLIKKALRKRFPHSKVSVTRGGESISWTDDGPTQVEVEEAIIAAGLVTVDHGRLRLPTGTIWFDRFNAAERAADEQRRERGRADTARIRQAATTAAKARSAALNAD